MVRVPEDLAQVWHELRRRFTAREGSDIARVAGLVSGEGCLVRRLLRYFCEELGRDCGHCGPSAGDPRAMLEHAPATIVFSSQELSALHTAHPRALGGTRELARFFCGIASPALSTAKFTRHPRFGSAAEVPFSAVMQAAKAAFIKV